MVIFHSRVLMGDVRTNQKSVGGQEIKKSKTPENSSMPMLHAAKTPFACIMLVSVCSMKGERKETNRMQSKTVLSLFQRDFVSR